MDQNSSIKPHIESSLLESQLVSSRTPYTDLLYGLLNARIAVKRNIFDDVLQWKLQKLELLFIDSFGHQPPESLAEIYRMIATRYDRGLMKISNLSLKTKGI